MSAMQYLQQVKATTKNNLLVSIWNYVKNLFQRDILLTTQMWHVQKVGDKCCLWYRRYIWGLAEASQTVCNSSKMDESLLLNHHGVKNQPSSMQLELSTYQVESPPSYSCGEKGKNDICVYIYLPISWFEKMQEAVGVLLHWFWKIRTTSCGRFKHSNIKGTVQWTQ